MLKSQNDENDEIRCQTGLCLVRSFFVIVLDFDLIFADQQHIVLLYANNWRGKDESSAALTVDQETPRHQPLDWRSVRTNRRSRIFLLPRKYGTTSDGISVDVLARTTAFAVYNNNDEKIGSQQGSRMDHFGGKWAGSVICFNEAATTSHAEPWSEIPRVGRNSLALNGMFCPTQSYAKLNGRPIFDLRSI